MSCKETDIHMIRAKELDIDNLISKLKEIKRNKLCEIDSLIIDAEIARLKIAKADLYLGCASRQREQVAEGETLSAAATAIWGD